MTTVCEFVPRGRTYLEMAAEAVLAELPSDIAAAWRLGGDMPAWDLMARPNNVYRVVTRDGRFVVSVTRIVRWMSQRPVSGGARQLAMHFGWRYRKVKVRRRRRKGRGRRR